MRTAKEAEYSVIKRNRLLSAFIDTLCEFLLFTDEYRLHDINMTSIGSFEAITRYIQRFM